MRAAITASILTMLWTPYASAGPADDVRLEGVSVHLFLEKSGSFSGDVTAAKDFQSWNFVPSGAGIPDDERFDDILIKVELGSSNEVFAKGRLGKISLSSAENGKLVETKPIGDLYLNGKGYRAFYVSGVACKPLVLTATLGKKAIRKDLPFRCGE